MQNHYAIIIFSLFTTINLVDNISISLRIRKLLKLNLLKRYVLLKPLECNTCLSFWIGLITSIITTKEIIGSILIAMASWLLAYIIDSIRNL